MTASIQVTLSRCIQGQEWHRSHLPGPSFKHGHGVGHPTFQRIRGINSVEEDEQSEPRLPLVVRGLCCPQGYKRPLWSSVSSPGQLRPDPHHSGPRCCSGSLLSLENPGAQVSASLGHPTPPDATSLDALSGACGIRCHSQNPRASSHPIRSPEISFWTWGMEDDGESLF